MRYRCPKNGRFVDEFTCMYCHKAPEGWEEVDPQDPYTICRERNLKEFGNG